MSISGVRLGDELLVDGGKASFKVLDKIGQALRCKCTDAGLLQPRAKVSFWRVGRLVEKNYELPTLSVKVTFSDTSARVLKACMVHMPIAFSLRCNLIIHFSLHQFKLMRNG